MNLLAQIITAPPPQLPTNGWDALVIMMPGILALIASTIAAVLGVVNGKKTDGVHILLNSELSKFKEDSAKSYDAALKAAISETKATLDRESAAVASKQELRIARLEGDLKAQADQLIAAVRQLPPISPSSVAPADPAVIAQLQRENAASIADRAAIHAEIIAAAGPVPTVTAPVNVIAPASPEGEALNS